MKTINILFILLMITRFTYCQNIDDRVEKVQIESVEFSIMTVSSVDCENFEEYFNNNYKTLLITDKDSIYELLGKIDKLEPIDSTFNKSVDTRAKIKLFMGNNTKTICIGMLSLKKDNFIYKTPQELVDYIENNNP